MSPRLREPVLGEVDRDDAFGARQPTADHRAQSDEPAAEDDAGRARLDASGVEGRADPGREPARERRAAFERRLRRDLRERDLRHDRVLRKGRRAHEVAHRLAVAGEARRPVWEVAEPLLVADRDAAVRSPAAAMDAVAALGREERHDVVARPERGHAVADLLDDSGALVTEHARRVPGRVGARGGVEVGVADPAGDEPHERLAGLRLGELELLDDERLTELLEHRGADLHGAQPNRERPSASRTATREEDTAPARSRARALHRLRGRRREELHPRRLATRRAGRRDSLRARRAVRVLDPDRATRRSCSSSSRAEAVASTRRPARR